MPKISFFLNICKNELFVFIFTFFFAFIPKYFINPGISSYVKCFTGGMILSIIIIHVFPDIYKTEKFTAPISAGISFLLLFSIDKLYIDSPDMLKQDSDSIPTNLTKAQTVVFVTALSVHSLFEGLSIPVKEEKELIWNLLGLLGHKWMEAFSLGLSVQMSKFSEAFKFFLTFFYAAMTPLGIFLGFLCSKKIADKNKNEERFSFMKDVLVGISAGSFMFIGFIEMINSEFNSEDTMIFRIQKMLTISGGFGIMSALLYIISILEKQNI